MRLWHSLIPVALLTAAMAACSPSSPPAQPTPSASPSAAATVSFATAQAIIQQRCVACHSQTPTRPGFNIPAGGVTFDSPEQIKSKADRILVRAVQTKSMPQGNVTGMTDAERTTLGEWITQGASLQ